MEVVAVAVAGHGMNFFFYYFITASSTEICVMGDINNFNKVNWFESCSGLSIIMSVDEIYLFGYRHLHHSHSPRT